MATTDRERSKPASRRGERARTASGPAVFYAVGRDDDESRLKKWLERNATERQRTLAGLGLGSMKAKVGAIAHIPASPSKFFVLDVDSLVQGISHEQPTVLFRLRLPRGEAQHADLVIEPARSPDMAQELLDASFDLVKQPDAEVEAMRRALTQRTVDSVLQGTRWLTSAELNSVRKDKTSNPSMTIGRWLQSGSMFALESRGSRVIPEYALDQLGEPIALLKPVLSLMKGRTGFLIAAWFESPNSYLDGKRPRELLATRGLDVVRAAEIHVAEDFHG